MAEICNKTEISPKKRKVEDGDCNEKQEPIISQETRFDGFQTKRVLMENAQRKMICVEGSFSGREEPAVVILEKTPLTETTAKEILCNKTSTQCILDNDIYGTFHLHPQPAVNALKATLIYPATEKHIQKYTAQEMFLLEESAADYEDITLPYIQSQSFNNQWVYNILSGTSEAERVVYRDEDAEQGFVLLPDMKWDGRSMEDLYLVAIAQRKDILSIRDLRGKDIVMLKNIRDKGTAAILEKYGIPANQLRIYLHYQPSYYHLHVHFTHLRFDAPGSSVERAHLLADVIDNLEMDGEYYAKRTLRFAVQKSSGLYKSFQETRAKKASE